MACQLCIYALAMRSSCCCMLDINKHKHKQNFSITRVHSLQIFCRFPGHMNDAESYRRLPAIGHGRRRNLPRRARLLADGGYVNTPPLITPRRIAYNRRQQNANRALRSIRIRVEYAIGFLKIYSATSDIFSTHEAISTRCSSNLWCSC